MAGPVKVPAQVAVFVEVLGDDGAVDFLLSFGGAELSIPKTPGRGSMLVKSLGLQKAAALCAQSDRIPRRIPTAKPWLAAHFKSKGLPVAEIARRLHASDVSVRTWLKRADPNRPASPAKDPRQRSLF